MFKLSNYAVTLALLTHHAKAQTNGDGLCEGTIATITGDLDSCTWANFQTEFDTDCNITELFYDQATEAFLDPQTQVEAICAYDAPTQFVEIQGTYRKDQRYFAGSGQLVDGDNWIVDSGNIERFEANMGGNSLIAWPEYAARLQYNTDNDLGVNGYPTNMNLDKSCGLQTAMCCFTDDSMGSGGSGFTADGALTTDVCRHDLGDSPQSNHIKAGWSVFPGTETPTHCVGFTWTDDTQDLIGNMMYDVSLRNTALHGYRGGVPGAPMCGCVEHMPTVAEASCRTATKTGDITFTFAFDVVANDVSASNTVAITYGDCANADLAGQYKDNHVDLADKALIDEHLVGVGGCPDDLVDYLNEEQFLHQGQHSTKYIVPDENRWSDLVVGEGVHFQPPSVDALEADAAFRALIDPSGTKCKNAAGSDRSCIIRRICSSCRTSSHSDIYYKRLTPLPPIGTNSTAGEVYFLDVFMNNWVDDGFNQNLVDFELYSSYAEAIAGDSSKAWTYCTYGNYDGYGFPRNCGPTSSAHEWNSYIRNGGYAEHHGFFVEKP